MKVIAIDFDGVIYDGSIPITPYRKKVMDTRERIVKLYDTKDNVIIIYTARSKFNREFIENVLKEYDIPYHALVTDKLRADIYIDDKNANGLSWNIKW